MYSNLKLKCHLNSKMCFVSFEVDDDLNISTKNLLNNIILFSPGNMYVVRSISLNTSSLFPRCTAFALVLEQSSDCDHNTVIYAESLIRRVKSCIPFFTHDAHHFLQSLIASHATHDQHFVRSHVCHRAFCNII